MDERRQNRVAEPSRPRTWFQVSLKMLLAVSLAAGGFFAVWVASWRITPQRSMQAELERQRAGDAIQQKHLSMPMAGNVRQEEQSDAAVDRVGNNSADAESTDDFVDDSALLLAQRKQLDDTIWRKEKRARFYEAFLVRLWDELIAQRSRHDGDKYAVFKAIPIRQLQLGTPKRARQYPHGIESWDSQPPLRTLHRADWVALLDQFRARGWHLVQSEWHHAAFDVDDSGAARSTVAMTLHVENQMSQQRVIVQGTLDVTWSREVDERGLPIPLDVDARKLSFLVRAGKPAFEEMLTVDPSSPARPGRIHPVIVYDVNGDGRNEILLGGCNRLYWNEGAGKFRPDTILAASDITSEIGIVADFNGDRRADFVTPGRNGELVLFPADADGKFTLPALGRQNEPGPLVRPQVVTAGDVDGDGDLDLWVAQYKPAYTLGQMPTPYYGANDGLPAFLLINNGRAQFQDATESAGLAQKRFRRSYGGCFVDLDDDADLDLLVVSDFAGIDIYYNDGSGHFTDVTQSAVDEWHNFGMSATFGDYDRNGQLDFFITGMASTTARRLEKMNLGRPDHLDIQRMRPVMGYGSRMYLATGPRYQQPPFRDQVARTGWTWGATSLDFDNDGFPDIYAANGHSSGKSTKDHCWHFWCHDIYTNSSELDRTREQLFRNVLRGYLDRSESWDGYQKNVLLMNVGGSGFVNVAFLMGVAKEYDARAVVGDDLDGDGRVDLLVVEDRFRDGQILHVYRNKLRTANHWIGVQLSEEGPHRSPLGTKVTVHTADGDHVGQILAGDSISAQHPARLHFGLGRTKKVEWIEARWVGGRTARIEAPSVDTYHFIRASDG